MKKEDLKEFLEEKYFQYNHSSFIPSDPVSIPHRFNLKEDIEISAFLTASIAWGQRQAILKNSQLLMEKMDYAPHQFILHFKEKDLKAFRKFVHRTFNDTDCFTFLKALQQIYKRFGALENAYFDGLNVENQSIDTKILTFRKHFLEIPHLKRTEKHISNPLSNSACKRMNMFLRWMVRTDKSGVDFGIWKRFNSSELMLPLDVHSGRVARSLGLLKRTQDDWKAVEEVTTALRSFDPLDPVKYDFALYGLGVFEKFK